MIALVTDLGSILIERHDASGDCIGCKRSGGGMALVTVAAVDKDDIEFIVCGNCVARGLRHVVACALEQRPEPPERLRFEERSLND